MERDNGDNGIEEENNALQSYADENGHINK